MKLCKKIICVLLAAVGLGCFAACGEQEEPAEQEKPAIQRTLLVGDSLFALWKPDYLTALEGMPNLNNIAVSGTNSVYWCNSYRLIKRAAPTTLIICIGTNNIADLHQTGKETAEGEKGIQAMLEIFHENAPDAHMYLLTVNLCGESIRWELREEIETCNALMREYCREKEWVDIVETEYAFYDSEDHEAKPEADYFVADYLHFSEKGYQRLTGILRDTLGLDK